MQEATGMILTSCPLVPTSVLRYLKLEEIWKAFEETV